MTELQLQLDDVIRTATAMRDAAHAGTGPDLADARILRGMAQCAEHLVEMAHVDRFRAAAVVTPEQDQQAQRDMTEQANEHADRLEGLCDIEGLLGDTESQLSGLRDNREAH